jgi:hypothetical protein
MHRRIGVSINRVEEILKNPVAQLRPYFEQVIDICAVEKGDLVAPIHLAFLWRRLSCAIRSHQEIADRS